MISAASMLVKSTRNSLNNNNTMMLQNKNEMYLFSSIIISVPISEVKACHYVYCTFPRKKMYEARENGSAP